VNNNIIQFPKTPKNTNNLTVETVKSNIDDVKQFHINETISAIIPSMLQQMSLAGFDIAEEENDVTIKDGAFLVEAMKSMLCRHYNIFHPFQKIADSIFVDENNDGSLEMVNEISINLGVDKDQKE